MEAGYLVPITDNFNLRKIINPGILNCKSWGENLYLLDFQPHAGLVFKGILSFMDASAGNSLQIFKNQVGIKYEMYNSLFTSLPFNKVEKTGVLLSLFLLHIEDGFKKQASPTELVESFFKQYTSFQSEKEKTDLLFRFIQYAERQVVLFDALEDAAFPHVNDMHGRGSLKHLHLKIVQDQAHTKLTEKLRNFCVRLVLTAHPTQFYPSEVLGIIHDLAKALANDNTILANTYLEQLGKTPFFKKQKPTPYDEAINLIWFLEHVFYQSAGRIITYLKAQFPGTVDSGNPLIRMGFWPGGDRDGNPFVTAETTLKVAESLRGAIIKSYYMDVRKLKRRLTFKGVDAILASLEQKLYNNIFIPGHKADITKQEVMDNLIQIRTTLTNQHNGLFLHLIDNLISKVELFGLYFATLDVRQDSSVHTQIWEAIAEKGLLPEDFKEQNQQQKIESILNIKGKLDLSGFENELFSDTFKTISAIKTIQQINGPEGCHRYIISHSTAAIDVMGVLGLFLLAGWKKEKLTIDIVPLFETIDDLQNAGKVMKELYENKIYRKHLIQRDNIQTIMLGFSDGTKDGGYLMANWSIYRAKEELSRLARQYDIQVVFFDGRGGPPARGGGKTHQFYASMGKNIASKEIQLTVQGQTISSNFGTTDSAQYNIEQLMYAGISNAIFEEKEITLTREEEDILIQLSDESYKAYNTLKTNPDFLEYLNFASPLRYYSETNIGSRPSKRKDGKLNLNDLRAVPYVGSWSQLKQNLPGYYGVGSALEKMYSAGKWNQVKDLYRNSLYFKTLMDNCEMAMNKCFFPVTAYLSEHPRYGVIWNYIYEEFERSKKYLLMLAETSTLMGDKPVDQLSIQMRQRIELPLVTIQQFALTKIREMEEAGEDTPGRGVFEKLVVRCSFGIINAERNSA